MSRRHSLFLSIPTLALTVTLALMPRIAHAELPWDSNFDAAIEDGNATVSGSIGGRESTPGNGSGNHVPSDDIPALTNSAEASPEAQVYAADDKCDGKTMHTVTLPDGTESAPFACAHITRSGTPESAGAVPTTREILYYAAATIHADGAGLRKRPEGVSYTNRRIPTLVNVTHPTQTHTVTLLGREVTVTLTAQEYTWDWGDDTPGTVTSSPGAAWVRGMDPNTDPALIRHYYTAPEGWKSFLDGPYPKATRTITLTTTWAGTATNPFTGETQTINGLVTTTETTDPFRLDHLIINNTDTAEEKQGH